MSETSRWPTIQVSQSVCPSLPRSLHDRPAGKPAQQGCALTVTARAAVNHARAASEPRNQPRTAQCRDQARPIRPALLSSSSEPLHQQRRNNSSAADGNPPAVPPPAGLPPVRRSRRARPLTRPCPSPGAAPSTLRLSPPRARHTLGYRGHAGQVRRRPSVLLRRGGCAAPSPCRHMGACLPDARS